MGYVRHGAPKELVLKLAAAVSADTFVETGTFRGDTAVWASQHFRSVVTIEIRPEISALAAGRADAGSNIQFRVGNSGELLPGIVADLTGPAVFWLDGHYSGPGTGDESSECPVMEELSAISKAVNPVVLIDDARCFLGPPAPPHDPRQWPRIDEIFSVFAQRFTDRLTTIHDDVILSVPRSLQHLIDEDWLMHFDSRFPPAAPVPESKFDLLKQRLHKVRNRLGIRK